MQGKSVEIFIKNYKKFIIIGDAGNFRGFWWNNPFFPISKGFNYYENRQTEIVQEILDE